MESQATRDVTRTMDRAVARVMAAVEGGPHAGNTALFVTTDHGMRAVERMVNIQRILVVHDIDARAIDLHPTATELLGIAAGQPVDGSALRDFLD